jgi:hypothetical protein
MTSLPNANEYLNDCTDLPKCLANYILALNEGDQMLSVRELSELFNASMGSVSAALNNLEEIQAISISRRGRLGSFLEKKSYGALWKTLENSPLVVAQTLPSFSKSEGLATAIYSLLDSAGIETYMTFIRGSFNRLNTLRKGRCHAVVISALAAEELCGPEEEIILRLPPQTFVTDHRVFYRNQRPDNSQPLRVGIDMDSYDIKYLTELEFSQEKVEYVHMPFVQTDRYLEQSPVDAAISNVDHIERLKSDGITSRPLSPRVQALVGDRDTSAVFVARANSNITKRVLQTILDAQKLMEIQKKVVDGLMVPRY